MKTLVYCPRNWNEPTHEWAARRDLCRKASRELGLANAVEVEDFASLQRLYHREQYRRVIVPSIMHIPPEVVLWLKTHRILIHDAMRLPISNGRQ